MNQPEMGSSYSDAYLTPPIEKTEDLPTLDDVYSSTPHNQPQQVQPFNLSTTVFNPMILQQQQQQSHHYSMNNWSYKEIDHNFPSNLNYLHSKTEFEDNSLNFTTDSYSPTLPTLHLSESSSGLEPSSRLSNNEFGSLSTEITAPTKGIITNALDHLMVHSKSPISYYSPDATAITTQYLNLQQPQHSWIPENQGLVKCITKYNVNEEQQQYRQHRERKQQQQQLHEELDSQTHQPITTMINLNTYEDPMHNLENSCSNAMQKYGMSDHCLHECNELHNTVPKHQYIEETLRYQLIDPLTMNYYTVGTSSEQLTPTCLENLKTSLDSHHNYHLVKSSTDYHYADPRFESQAMFYNCHSCQPRKMLGFDTCLQTCGHSQFKSGNHMKIHCESSRSNIDGSGYNNNDSQNTCTHFHSNVCPNQRQSEYLPNIASSSKHYIIDPNLRSPNKQYCLDSTHNVHLTCNASVSQHHNLSADRLIHSTNKRHCKRRHSCNRGSDTSSSHHTFNSSHPSSQQSVIAKQQLDSDRIRFLIPPGPSDGCLKWLQNSNNLFQTLCVYRGLNARTSEFMNRDSAICDQIQFRLRDYKIWSQMCVHDTEMIATNMGRRIFPSLSVDVFGLNPVDEYIFVLDMVLIQPHVFKHQNGKWIVSAQSDEPRSTRVEEGHIYIQEDSPKSGAYWMESGVNFIRAKITNSKEVKVQHNMIHVHSMQYYLPRFTVIRLTRPSSSRYNPCKSNTRLDDLIDPNSHNQYDLIGCYVIPGTQFYTVTAYQNPDVIRIKINNNPFAKGFRNRQDTTDLEDAVLSAMGMRSNFTDSTTIDYP